MHEKTLEIKNKFNLEPSSYFPADFDPFSTSLEDQQLIFKRIEFLEDTYKDKIPEEWSGFWGLSVLLPPKWFDVIEYLIHYIDLETKGDFQIHEVKIKFGEIRAYFNFFNIPPEKKEELQTVIKEVCSLLCDEKLIF
jgi:hypothetical protein